MRNQELTVEELEDLYERLARALDAFEGEERSVFLAKVVLTLAARSGDAAAVREAITIARGSRGDDAAG